MGKEIIENMTKSEAKLAPRSSAVNIGSLKVQLKYPSVSGASSSTLYLLEKRELADKLLICEAFNVAAQIRLTPKQLQIELEKQKELYNGLKEYGAERISSLTSEFEKSIQLILKLTTNFSVVIDSANEQNQEDTMTEAIEFLKKHKSA